MIEITHANCWYVRRKATILGCRGAYFVGIGIPLPVVLHSFQDKNIAWFSLVWGDFDANTLLIGMRPDNAKTFDTKMHGGVSPIAKALGSQHNFVEYVLSPEIQAELGITLNSKNNSFTVGHEAAIEYQIGCHDDCAPFVKLDDKGLLKELINSVLQQHSYYLQIEVDWTHVLSTLTEQVNKSKALIFKSDPTRRCLIIRREGFLSFMKAVLAPKSLCAVIIEDEKATLSKNYLRKLRRDQER